MSEPKILTTFDFSDATTFAESMTIDDSDNYIVVGRSFPNNSYEPNSYPYFSAFAVKINNSGNIIWKKTYSNEYGRTFNSITKLSDGSLIVLGSYSCSSLSSDQFTSLTRLDNDGNIVQDILFGLKGVQSNGKCIAPTSDGGFVMALSYIDNVSPSTTVTKFSSNITLEWSKTFNIDVADSIIQTSDGGYALSGLTTWDESFNSNPFIVKLNIYGEIVWKKEYGKIKNYVPAKTSIIETKSKQFVVVASYVIFITNELGELISYASNVITDESGNIISYVTGNSYSLCTVVEIDNTTICVAGSELFSSFDRAFGALVTIPSLEFTTTKSANNYPSGISQLVLDKNNSLAACGYVSNDGFLAIF